MIQKKIWFYFTINSENEFQSLDIFTVLENSVSQVTVKKYLSELESENVLQVRGRKRIKKLYYDKPKNYSSEYVMKWYYAIFLKMRRN